MPKKLPYFLLLAIIGANSLVAQQAETGASILQEEQQEIIYVQEKQEVQMKEAHLQHKILTGMESYDATSAELLENASESISSLTGIITEKFGSNIDSISNIPTAVLQNVTDSLSHLTTAIKSKVQSRIDSLQQKLDDLKSKGDQKLGNASEKVASITAKIDSLQNRLTDKLQLDKLGKYGKSANELTEKLNVPALENKSILPVRGGGGLEKLQMPGMQGLNTKIPGMDKLSLPDNGPGSLHSLVDKRLGKLGDLSTKEWIKTDLSGQQMPDDVQSYLSEVQQYGQVLKDPSKVDGLVDARAAQMSEAKLFNDQTKELDAMKQLPESMLADLKRFRDAQAMKAEAKEVAVKKATDYFASHQDKLTEAQGMMSKLKKKYSYVPDSRDLSTAVKATSLKDESLKKRLVFGLGFQIQRTNPIALDLSPNLLYRFNKLFSAGISGTYRASLGIENNSSVAVNTAQDVYGASAIAQHKVWKGFFGYGEFQYLSTPMVDPATGTDLPTRSWHKGLLLGIGKQMSLSKALKGQIIFTYDFLHTSASPNPKAWNLKFGFQFGKFKLKDINL